MPLVSIDLFDLDSPPDAFLVLSPDSAGQISSRQVIDWQFAV
jgi:hypothetical protein